MLFHGIFKKKLRVHTVELVPLYGLGGLVVDCVCAKCDPWSEYLLKLVKS